MIALEAVELYRFYHSGDDETFALRGLSLQLRRGELLAIMGPSGSGKSTLLACLAGLDEPDGGHVELLGQRLTRRPEVERAALRARHIGFLRQSSNLFEHLTVGANIGLQLKLARRRPNDRLGPTLDRLGLRPLLGSLPSQLSGGEAARAAIAVALAADPMIMLADEPTAEVDARTAEGILSLLAHRRNEGRAALVVTHSALVAHRADRIIHLRDGYICDD
jgi:putative ABC transport system ATP-binding protein